MATRPTLADLIARIDALQAQLDAHKAQITTFHTNVETAINKVAAAGALVAIVTNDPAKPLPLAHYRALRDAVIAGRYDEAKPYLAAVAARHGDASAETLKRVVWTDAKRRGAAAPQH